MIKRKSAYKLIGGLLAVGLVLNAPSMATYVQNLNASQTITAATWSVELGNNLGEHTIFPGDTVSNDTITLKNNNNYPVKYTIKLTNEGDVEFNNALSLNVTHGTNSYTEKSGEGEVVVGQGRTITLNSNVVWNTTDNDTIHAGKQVKYNYDITAEKVGEDVKPSVSSILESVSAYSTGDQITTTFKINENLNLDAYGSDDNIIIQYLKEENGQYNSITSRKDKMWSGFLNGPNDMKYPKGGNPFESNTYSNTIVPGTYSSTTDYNKPHVYMGATHIRVTVVKDGVKYSDTVAVREK